MKNPHEEGRMAETYRRDGERLVWAGYKIDPRPDATWDEELQGWVLRDPEALPGGGLSKSTARRRAAASKQSDRAVPGKCGVKQVDHNLVRLKNGITFYGLYSPWSKHGDVHEQAVAVVFPDGTKVRRYRYNSDVIADGGDAQILAGSIETLDDGRKVGAQITAGSIEYPDGRKVENPSADEIQALFPKEGREVQVEIGATIAIGTFVSDGKWACKSLNPDASDRGDYRHPTEEAALEDMMCMLDQANVELDWSIDNVIYIKADGTFTMISVAEYAAEYAIRWKKRRETEIKRAVAAGEFHDETSMDIISAVNALFKAGVNLDDRAAVEQVVINPYKTHPEFGPRFVSWCIKTAKINAARYHADRHPERELHCGIVYPESADTSVEERIIKRMRESDTVAEIERAVAAGEFHSETIMDVVSSVRALRKTGVDLDDRAAVERVLINPYKKNPEFGPRFVSWCINAARFQGNSEIVGGEFADRKLMEAAPF
jgi:hypothetical protein